MTTRKSCWTRCSARPEARGPGGRGLAGCLRPPTGFPFPVVTGRAGDGDIGLALGRPPGLQPGPDGEGYQLDVSARGITLPVHITDYPRDAYRGMMLDIARHYEPPGAVNRVSCPG